MIADLLRVRLNVLDDKITETNARIDNIPAGLPGPPGPPGEVSMGQLENAMNQAVATASANSSASSNGGGDARHGVW